MTKARKASLIAAAATIIGWDLGTADTTAHWPTKPKPAPSTKKRAKVKAARKQRIHK